MSEIDLSDDIKRVSYGVGLQIGQQLRQNPIADMSLENVLTGISDAFTGHTPRLTQPELEASFKLINERIQQHAQVAGAEAAEAGTRYLAENAQREGVIVTPSGLQYEVLIEGNGPRPTVESKVLVHYQGALINGQLFDSSYQRGQPAEFPVKAMIPGWVEALQMMSAGSKWRVHVPSNLAYGEQMIANIPPNSTLVFDLELLDVKD